MVDKNVSVLIIGGGLIGATLNLALTELGFSTLLVEAQSFVTTTEPDFDARSLALSPASQRILSRLGVWHLLEKNAQPIDMIHVSDKKHFGVSRLHKDGNESLGYVLEMHHINAAVHQVLAKDSILAPATLTAIDTVKKTATIKTENGAVKVAAQLIVAADGAESSVRRMCGLQANISQYSQHALVANIGLQRTHNNYAYERFTPKGPLAFLPLQGLKMSLVWTLPPAEAKAMQALDDKYFLQVLQKEFGYRLGRFVKAGKRMIYPLKQVLMPQQAKWPLVFVGNAAHTLHPVAGQGFNLGLRDVATLAQCCKEQGLAESMLETYIALRKMDQSIITKSTDGLIHLFSSRIPGLGLARSLGLIAVDNSDYLKNTLARYARGFGGFVPDLVCGIALAPEDRI